MAQQQKSGKPWSGANPIPSIQQFVENLDKDKAKRDKEIDQQMKNKQQDLDTVTPHQNEVRVEGGRQVTDPVTGNTVTIADVGKEFMANVDNPMVRRSLHLLPPRLLTWR